jgi:hypothetical protein
MDALRKATAGVGVLFLVNDLAPVSWSDESDEMLSEAARTWPHTELIDWRSVVARHLDGLTWDGLHLTPAGAGVYTRLITKAVRSAVKWPKPAPPERGGARKPGSKHVRKKSHKRPHGAIRSAHSKQVADRRQGA